MCIKTSKSFSILIAFALIALFPGAAPASPSTAAVYGASLTGTETLTNKTIDSGTIAGVTAVTGTLGVNAVITGTSLLTQAAAAATYCTIATETALSAVVSTATGTLATATGDIATKLSSTAAAETYTPLTRVVSVTLVSTDTVTLNSGVAGVFNISATGNFYLSTPTAETAIEDGRAAVIRITPSGAIASSTCVLSTNGFIASSTALTTGTIVTNSAQTSIIHAIYDATGAKWQVFDVKTGF